METAELSEQVVEHERSIDWSAIRDAWCNGASSTSLAAIHGISDGRIRQKAMRGGWSRKVTEDVHKTAKKLTQIAVSQELKRIAPEIARQSKESVNRVLAKSLELGERMMERSLERVTQCDDRSASSIAQLGKSGVSIAREALGLSTSGERESSVALNVHLVLRGDSQANHALPVGPVEPPAIDV